MAGVLERTDLQKLLERIQDPNGELKAALITTAAIWGVKAGELSLIEVGDVVDNKGRLKKRWALRKAIAFNGHQRELYTEHESLVRNLNRYLDWRVSESIGVTNLGEFRGLDPDSRLFLMPNGEPFGFSRRSREGKANMQPTGMNGYFKRLIRASGLPDVTFKEYRCSLASQMYRDGGRITGVIKDIMEYLGIRSYSAMKKIFQSDTREISEMLKGLHTRL